MALGSPDIFASDSSSETLFSAPVGTTGEREPLAAPDAPLAPPPDPRAALDAMLSGVDPKLRTDFLARFDALDPDGRKEFAAESGKIAGLFRSGRDLDARRLLERILPQRREANENLKDTYNLLVNAIGRENIEKSPAFAEAKQKITPKTHPDPKAREEAITAYAIIHDPGLQAIARQNLGDARANDLLFDLQRQFPDPKTPPIRVPNP